MKRYLLEYSLTFLSLFAILLCGTSIQAAVETTVEGIVADKDSYDGKEVSVIGAVSTPRFRASRHRKPYMTFPLLGDSGSRINVLFWGDIKLKTGKKIKVQGIYRKTMEMGKYTFRDVIESTQIETEIKIQGKNPLEIIAIIMAESNFKENSIHKETGDYGLGQINWEHWGKDFGWMPHQLLDPSINIFLTCHVYKFFGNDFGKYHRGNGIQSRAYLVNVRSILSTLNAFVEGKKENIS